MTCCRRSASTCAAAGTLRGERVQRGAARTHPCPDRTRHRCPRGGGDCRCNSGGNDQGSALWIRGDMKFAELDVSAAEGAILAHSAKHHGGIFKKGRVLSASDIELLQASGVKRIFAARLETGDVPEDAAAAQMANAIAGGGVSEEKASTGRS